VAYTADAALKDSPLALTRHERTDYLRVHMAVETAPAPAPSPPSGGNVHGRARALTLLTPVRPLWTPFLWLVMRSARYHTYFRDHSLQFKFIYYVRWAIFQEFPGGEKKRYPYLFFESNFDIPWRQYIDAFAYVIPKDISVIWGRGFAFPGPPPAEPLKRWIAMNSLEGGHYYMAYPQASVKMTMASLEARDRCEELAKRVDSMSPQQFRKAFDEALGDLQFHL
jgi:hypothetical protein